MGKAQIIKKLKSFKAKLAQKYSINKMIFFGSRASGKPHAWSDIDLVIVSPEFKGKSALTRAPHFYLEWDLKYPVDFLCYSPSEFNKLRKKLTVVNQAVKTGIEI